MQSRIEDLEIRSAHQEWALEELSEQVRAQLQMIEQMRERIRELESRLRSVAPGAVGPESEETPPPHY